MSAQLETTVRDNLAAVLTSGIDPADLDPSLDLSAEYGLTSLNKVLFMMSVCGDTGVDLGAFTEADVAGMHTLDDVIAGLNAQLPHEG